MADELPLIGREAEVRDAVAALQAPGSVVLLVGPLGVGRTRMARSVASALTRAGLDAVVLDDVHQRAPEELAGLGGESEEQARWVATAPLAAPLPSALLDRATERSWHRVELAPLDQGSVGALLHAAIGAPLDQRSVAELTRASGGLPLYLLAIIDDARADGSLVVEHDQARWSPERFTPARLGDLVAARLADCEEEVRHAIELVATTGALPLEVLQAPELGYGPAVLRAEGAGLLEGQRVDSRVMVDLTPPAVGLAASVRVPVLRRLAYLDQALRSWDRMGSKTPADRLRMATWSLELGRDRDPNELIDAAGEAMRTYQYHLAEELARAGQSAGHPGAPTLVAEALEKQGRHGDALDALPDDESDASGRIVRAANLYWARAALHEAEEVLTEETSDATPSPTLEATRAWLLMADGRRAEATSVAERVRTDAPPDDPNHTWATVVAALGLALAGDGAGALELTGSLGSFATPGAPFERSAAGLTRAFAFLASGRVHDAVAFTAEGLDWAVGERVEILSGAWYGLSGMAHRAAGNVVVACAHLHQAVSSLGGDDPYRFSRLFSAEAAAAWAQRGDAARARSWWESTGERDPQGLNRIFEPWIGRLGAWVLAAEGDLPAATGRALAAADNARDLGQPFCEMAALHVVARLGRASTVADRADELAARVASPPLRRLSEAIAAAAAHDGPALRAAATTFADLGAQLLAAEAVTTAAQAHRRHHEEAAAIGALEVRAHLLERCAGAATPGLSDPGHTTLTARERDVALLAARGVASAEIAARLGCSRRTVDNHLGRVYDKLGVRRRRELGALLGAGAPPTG